MGDIDLGCVANQLAAQIPKCSFRFLYSTQSGRAKACSRRTCRLVLEKFPAQIDPRQPRELRSCDEDFALYQNDLHNWAENLRKNRALLLLFISTTGDGEHTDTIQRLWRQL